jgi:glycosyltransferase involved in cell wall biosynthesis
METGHYIPFEEGFQVKYFHDTIIGRFSFQMMTTLWRDIRKADVVHAHPILSNVAVYAIIYGVIFGKPVVISPRGNLGEWSLGQGAWFKKLWLGLFFRPFKHRIYFHATSRKEEKDIRRIFGNVHTFMVPNGVDLTAFGEKDPQFDMRRYLADQFQSKISFKRFIITLGRLHHVKGLDKLIQAFALVSKEQDDMALIIAGNDDGELENLQRLSRRLHLEDRIFFPGHVDGQLKTNLLAAADVFVLASKHENFGNVVVEALAAGTPVVTTRNTPWEELETAGCGFWVEDIPEELASAVLKVLQGDRVSYRKKAEAFSERFSWEVVAHKMKENYQIAIQQNL